MGNIKEKKYLPSFARRISRKLSVYQKELLDSFLQQVLFSKESLELVYRNYSIVRFEIGFGGGEHLVAQALKHPDILYIGCEPYLNGVVKVLDQIKIQDLKNILIYPNDAREALELLGSETLETVYILYPDPWPKTKQKKRRIVSFETLKAIHEKLIKTGKLIIATDHEDYAKSTLKTIDSSKLFCFREENPDFRLKPEGWITTKYETKALGGESYYFLLDKFIS